MPQLLYLQGKSLWYPLDRRLGGPQSHSGCGSEEKNSQPPLLLKISGLYIFSGATVIPALTSMND